MNLKQVLFATIFSLAFPIVASSQAAILVLIFGNKIATEKFHLSIDAGLNTSAMTGFGSGDPRVGIHFGLGVHIKLDEHWFFAPEFTPVNWRGQASLETPFDLPPELGDTRERSRFRLNYLDIPLLLQYRFSSPWYISAGPQMSFLTSARQYTRVTLSGDTVIDVDQSIKGKFKSFDLSVPVEVGYAFENVFAGRGFDLRLRYGISLLNIDNDAQSDRTVRNSTLQLIVTLPFVVKED